ncbi:Ig-like domain-containing protein [Paenibacillus sp. CGMCC 1.16610]|nr:MULTISPECIES: Ig-like domain-containing protein [Paenibacillus]MBA2939710.1 Ig-like domain-containing protein [Paenibacillus sp. CGMCC 1.16610]
MKKNLWERVLPLPHRKHISLTLTSVLALSPIVAALPAHAANTATIAASVGNKDINWIPTDSKSILINPTVTGDTLSLDISAHTNWANENGMTLTATSQSTAVASAAISGQSLTITAISGGTALITLKAEKSGRNAVIDTIQVSLTRIGDTNGDGNVTSADALYITKLVNTTPPITDPEEINRLDINRDGKLTKEDATALLSNYVGKSGAVASTYIVNLKEVNDAPTVAQAAIQGQLKINETLQANAQYQDVEGDAMALLSYQWYRGKNVDGTDKSAISSATANQYTIGAEDVGQFLFVEITPKAQSGTLIGQPTLFNTATPVPDTTPPVLDESLQPLGSMSKSAMTSDFILDFNEAVKAGAGSIHLRKKSDNSVVTNYLASDTTTVTFNGDKVTLKNPGLADVTEYYIEVDSTAVLDTANNAFEGFNGSSTWHFTTPDTTAPTLSSRVPANQANDGLKNSDLQMTFNEAVKAASGKNITIYKTGNTQPLAVIAADDTAHVTISGSTVLIKHADLPESENYYVLVESGAFTDLSDNVFEGVSSDSEWAFYVPDITPPVISILTPLNGAKNVSVSDDFKLTFNENVKAVTGKQLSIKNAATHNEVAAIDVDDTSKVTISGAEVLIKNPGLATDASFFIEVPDGAFEDSVGNVLKSADVPTWAFTTLDTIAPTLTATSPVTNGKTATVDADLTMTFSESITLESNKEIKIWKAADQQLFQVVQTNDASHVSISSNIVTLKDLNLEENVSYYITIETGAFKDEAENRFAGLDETSAWHFATPDLTPPTATTVTPANLATQVDPNSAISVTFDEAVKAGNGKFVTIRKISDNSEVAKYASNDTAKVTISGARVTFVNPGLADETGYYIDIENGAFADLSDNAFAGMSGSSNWSFTTPDTTPPVVSASLPSNHATEVSKSDAFTITFNENIQADTGNINLFKSTDTSAPIASYASTDTNYITISGKTITIKNPGLDDFTNYYISIDPNAITDLSGNKFTGLDGSLNWSFWSPDTRTFSVTNFEDFKEDVMKSTGGAILDLVLSGDTFKDQTISLLSSADITLHNAPAGLSILSADWVGENEAYLSLDYDGTDFDTDITNFGVTIKGNALVSGRDIKSQELTITAIVEPEIISVSPINGQTGIGKSDNLTMTFSKAVTAVAGKNIAILKKSDNTIAATINAGDSSKVTISGMNVTVQHADLSVNTDYYVTIEEGAFIDSDSNPFAGIQTNSIWAFKTISNMAAPTLSPATNSTEADPNGELTLTLEASVTAVGGKNIQIYKKSDNALIETIDAGNASKVTVNGSTVTIKHVPLVDKTEYYVTVDAGAFQDSIGRINPAISSPTDWAFKTVEFNVAPFFTDFVDAGDGRIAFQIAVPTAGSGYGGYSVWLNKYVKATNTTQSVKQYDLRSDYDRNMLHIAINNIFYDAMDVMPIWYYNEEFNAYDPTKSSVSAYTIRDSTNKIVDVLGDPTATTDKPFLPAGGTLVRKTGMLGGVSFYHPFQWTTYPKGTFQYMGQHTN